MSRRLEGSLLLDGACVLGLSIAWFFFRGDVAIRALSLTLIGPTSVGFDGYYLYIGALVAAGLLLPLLSRGFESRPKVAPALLLVSSAVSPLVLAGCYLEGAPGAALCFAGAVALAVFAAGSAILWGALLCSLTTRRIFILVSLSFAVSSFLSFISLFPQTVYLTVLAFMPLFSAVLYAVSLREAGVEGTEKAPLGGDGFGEHRSVRLAIDPLLVGKGPQKGERPNAGAYSLVVLLAVFCVVGFSIRGMVAPLEAISPVSEMVLVNVVTMALGLLAAVAGRKVDMRVGVYFIARAFMVGLFAALCLSITLGQSPYALIINAVSLVARAGITYALFLTACLYSHWFLEHRMLGVGIMFMVPQALASAARSLLFQFETALEAYTVFAAPVMLFVLIVAVLVLSPFKGGSASRGIESSGSGKDDFGVDGRPSEAADSVGRALAARYGLTNRERDIADCLARGYTLQKTADELFISMNTVRTHAKSVYRKMGIGSKQELIDLVEKQGSEPGNAQESGFR